VRWLSVALTLSIALVACVETDGSQHTLDATTVVPTTTPTPRVSSSSAPKASIEDRLRGQPGIFEGVRLPRLRHWSEHLSRAYRSAFSLCARIGVRNLAIQLHVNRNPDDVAIAVLPGFKKRDWRAAHQGCADGLAWNAGRR
jgi:hypothetical protein